MVGGLILGHVRREVLRLLIQLLALEKPGVGYMHMLRDSEKGWVSGFLIAFCSVARSNLTAPLYPYLWQ